MKRLLLLGSTGKMGYALKERKPKGFEILELPRGSFDPKSRASIDAALSGAKPDVLINAIAFMGIDPCEQDPAEGFAINARLPQMLAEYAHAHGVTFVHLSTDAVFGDSPDGRAYDEDSVPEPVNLYGVSKLAGEKLVAAAMDNYYIARIATLFGPSPKNTQFVEKMLSMVEQGRDSISIADDIICSPCYNMDMADAIYRLIQEAPPPGTYHLANAGSATLYELITAIFTAKSIDCAVHRASYQDFPYVGRKNLVTPLTTKKGIRIRGWEDAVQECYG